MAIKIQEEKEKEKPKELAKQGFNFMLPILLLLSSHAAALPPPSCFTLAAFQK